MTRDTPRERLRLNLIETAARLIATEGVPSLTARRVADETGTSTMAIYTHFGGMDGLRHAVRREGFTRLGTRLRAVDSTDDPVTDLSVLGLAYFHYATDERDLYRVMFVEPTRDAIDAEICWATFDALVHGVGRCISAGRFHVADAPQLATQLWAVAHGTVTLHLAGLLEADTAVLTLGASALHLFTGFGDKAARAERSLAHALERAGGTALTLLSQ